MDTNADTAGANDPMRDAWNRVASGWGKLSDVTEENQASASQWLISRTAPQPGDVVLDVAAGAGGLGRLVAARVAPDGRVLSTDFAPEMVEVCRELAEASGLENMEFRTLDAQRMDLEDASIDVALCRSGIMLMLDPAAALRELRRVLRPAGRLGFSVFTSPEDNPWATRSTIPFVRAGHVAPPVPGGPGMFALGDADRLRELVLGAGFGDVVIEEVDYEHTFADEDAIWDLAADMNALLAPILQAMEPAEQTELRREMVAAYEPWRSSDGAYRLPGRMLAALATAGSAVA